MKEKPTQACQGCQLLMQWNIFIRIKSIHKDKVKNISLNRRLVTGEKTAKNVEKANKRGNDRKYHPNFTEMHSIFKALGNVCLFRTSTIFIFIMSIYLEVWKYMKEKFVFSAMYRWINVPKKFLIFSI